MWCDTCGGSGYEVEEHLKVVLVHHPSCVGGSECASTCPVPKPVSAYEPFPCRSCNSTGLIPERLERAARGMYESIFGRVNVDRDKYPEGSRPRKYEWDAEDEKGEIVVLHRRRRCYHRVSTKGKLKWTMP